MTDPWVDAARRLGMPAPIESRNIGCSGCTGFPQYRVRLAQMPDPADNLDQLVDHMPMMFSSEIFLEGVYRRGGQVTVWRLNSGDDGIGVAEVVAYAGPDPVTGGRTWWCAEDDR